MSGKSYRAAGLCLLHSLLLVAATYLWMNVNWQLPDEQLIARISQILRYVIREDPARIQSLQREFLFVNCSYDKKLTDFEDAHGMGQMAITDRQKLANLLGIYRRAVEKPKLIILDLGLMESSPDDSLLVREITSSPNLVLGWDHELGTIQIPSNVKKAEAIYFSQDGSFLTYQVLGDESVRLATAMYETLQKKKARPSALGFVWMDHDLWLNSFIVDIEMREIFLDNGSLAYLNLGELLASQTEEEIASGAKNRIVILGDYFLNDQHDTVLGTQPGPLIVANAYVAMNRGQATIGWTGSLLLFLFYFVVTRRIVRMTQEENAPAKENKIKFIRFVLKYMTYLLVFSIVSVILYQMLGKHFQILLFAFYFNGLEYLIKRYDSVRNAIKSISFGS